MGMRARISLFQLQEKFSLMISRSLIFFSPLNKLHVSEHSLSPKSSSLRKLTLRVSNNKTGEVSVRGLRFTEGGKSFCIFWEMIMGSRGEKPKLIHDQ